KKDYSGQNPFTKIIYDLVPNTTYYVRAYAINSEGTVYGGVQSFTTTSSTNWTPSGDGSNGNPYQINNLNNLVWMMETESSWDSYFELTADIDASATSTWDGGKGFAPIGRQTPTEDQFNGFFEGNGYVISNLTINRPNTNDVGLFGYTDRNYSNPSSYVRNLGLESVNITGGYRIAGFIGRSTSLISNCYVTGSITGDAGNSIAAGLVAQSNELVENSYSRASVSAKYEAAGFVSFNDSDIENCYSTGAVTNASENLDGFCNDVIGHGGGTIANSFWDTQTSGQASSSGGTGKTTSEMKTLATFTSTATSGLTTAWDFETNPNDDAANNDYWDLDETETINNGYPFLSWQNGGETALPIELSSFTAETTNGQVVLSWQTDSETNNAAFLIYRNDEVIGRIDGAGTTSEPQLYSYVDAEVVPGVTYTYVLADVDYDNTETKFNDNAVTVSVSNSFFEKDFVLGNAYPNPFNPITILPLTLSKESVVNVGLYDLAGHEVKSLINATMGTGTHTISIDGTDLMSGIYMVKVATGNTVDMRKIVLVK
ncbi:MAG: T9SS type A sorting domain-containing protein, partial [Candidatus Marinimicrobia bacterium]|nr:T9SS type A sorting domain-containing protein [Candidatus Neomarinimicrobiota bacterium]